MIRHFTTSTVRRQTELSGQYWRFHAPVGDINEVFVPSCWENSAGLERFRGKCVYEKAFTAEGNTRIVFKGVSFWAKVYLDGALLGTHYGAYTPFEFIAKGLIEGEHQLKVEVSNEFSDESALHIPNDYRSYGGITRGVLVESLQSAYIRRLGVIPVRRGDVWRAQVTLLVENLANSPLMVKPELCLAGETLALEKAELRAGEVRELTAEVECPSAITYTPEAPELYLARATLYADGELIDDIIERVGFRTVSIEGESILLNGSPIQIRGVNRHETHGQFGCSLPIEAMAQDIAIMKDLHINMVRTCHYPNDELFLDLCDEQGLLVWEESHARGLSVQNILNPRFDEQSRLCIDEMILSHINHPSIILWGCLNECPSYTDAGRKVYEAQIAQIRALDASRPVTTASCFPAKRVYSDKPQSEPVLAHGEHDGDICLDLVDVVSFNIYPEWYLPTDAISMINRLTEWADENGAKDKPFIISEIGAGAIYGFRSRAGDKWSEEGQARILKNVLEAVARTPRLSGVIIWQFCDCLVDGEWAMSRPKTQNNKGIVDIYRRPKLGYDTVREQYGNMALACAKTDANRAEKRDMPEAN